jgi:chromosomal replication initiator protein
VTPDLAPTWQRIAEELQRAVPESTFEIWLAPLRAVSLEETHLTVSAPPELRAWVSERFGRLLQACAAVHLGPEAVVDVVDVGARTAARKPGPGGGQSAGEPRFSDGGAQSLNPKYTFDGFVIGDSNRFAHAAALAVAEMPGGAYNPLFIYGPPGVGKTHLLHSIGNYVQVYGGGMRVRYTTIERFTNEFIAALQDKSIDAFKGRYRQNDLLLIDDVQFLASKAKTEEEFFHTFNALYESGSQMVLTCDRLPRDLGALEDRLRERFEAGLMTDILPPDEATRLTVLRKRVQHDGISISDGAVLELLADRIPTNIRQLEGALIRVVAFASLTQKPITPELAEKVLAGLYPETQQGRRGGIGSVGGPAPVTVERVQDLVCEAFGITHDELLSSSRTARLAWPRQVAMYLAREHTDATLPSIGRSFGGRNHTTVMHACRRTAERMAGDRDAYEAVRSLTTRLGGTSPDRRD